MENAVIEKTNEATNGMVAMFHEGRGGRFYNGGHLAFVGFKKITECHDFQQNTFMNEAETQLTDCNGNELMDAEELQVALNTGIGCLNFDMQYNTTFTRYVKDLNENEAKIMLDSHDWNCCGDCSRMQALRELGVSDLDYQLATYFDDLDGLIYELFHTFGGYESNSYAERWYEKLDVEPEDDNVKYYQQGNEFYVKI